MKRTFQEFEAGQAGQAVSADAVAGQQEEETKQDGGVLPLLYGLEAKKRKVDEQRIGDFIVKGLDSVHFKIVSDGSEVADDTQGSYFAPKFLYWLLGQEERIQGYEGLSVLVCLSSKRLIPYLKITYAKKAPPFAKIDDIEQLFTKHYGTLYTDLEKYQTEVLDAEKTQGGLPGSEFIVYEAQDQIVQRVRLSDATFHENNYYLQALLPFFIEGAVIVEPTPFWNYFMVFEKTSEKLMGLFTVYEAHLSMDRYRTKVSQVLVLPPYQRRGIASRVYDLIYKEYRVNDTRCLELLVEDAAEEFQKVQDLTHAKVMLSKLDELSKETGHSRAFHAIPAAIVTGEEVKERQLDLAQIKKLSGLLKLPQRVILQINDLLVHSRLPEQGQTAANSPAWTEFRMAVKRRFYVRCHHLFPGAAKKLTDQGQRGLGGEPYIWNEILEDDQFARQIGNPNSDQNEEALQMIGGMAGKIQLNTMFEGLCKMFEGVKGKIATLQ